MKISVLTSFFNGDLMIPYFMSHYAYADEIIVLFNDHGKPIDAATKKLVTSYPNARLAPFAYPAIKTDYSFAADLCNRTLARLDSDWAIVASADELIFPVGMQDTREVLGKADGVVITVALWWAFRHRTDVDLDPTLPAIWQRRHGSPIREGPGCIKPAIVRPNAGIRFSVGAHGCSSSRGSASTIRFDGSHWLHADPTIGIQRRLRGRRENMSANTLRSGLGAHHFDITEAAERAECAKFIDAPQVF